MKINLNAKFETIKGEPFHENGDKTKVFSLKEILMKTILLDIPDEKLNGEAKFKRYGIANRLNAATDSIEMTAEEVAAIKKTAGLAWGVECCGALYTAIEDGKETSDNVTKLKG